MDSSLNFTLDSDNLPSIKLLGNEIFGIGNLGMLLKSGSLYFPTENSLTNNERNGPYIRSENNRMIFGMANEDAVYITSDGKVGIGTADPSYNVHVYVPLSLGGDKGGLRLSCGNSSSFYWKHWSTTSSGARNTGNGMQFFSGVSKISWKISGTYRMLLKYVPYQNSPHQLDTGYNNQYNTSMLGMGTSNTRCPLDLGTWNVGNAYADNQTENAIGRYWARVFGFQSVSNALGGTGEGNGGGPSYGNNSAWTAGYITLMCTGNVIGLKYGIFSDRRVKTNIQEMNHAESLDTLRLLQPCSFEYIDKIQKTSHPVDGLISQEVIEIIPQAITYAKETLPNIFQMGTYTIDSSGNQFIFLSDYNMENLQYDASGNIYPKLCIYNDEENGLMKKVTIIDIPSSNCIQISTDETLSEKIFVYGQNTDNYQHLNYHSVFTLCTSALKEIDKQLTDHTSHLDSLEQQMQDVDTMITEMEAILA